MWYGTLSDYIVLPGYAATSSEAVTALEGGGVGKY